MNQPTDICLYCGQQYTDGEEHRKTCYELKRMRSFSYPGMKQNKPDKEEQ